MAGIVPDHTHEPISIPTHIIIINASTVLLMLSNPPAKTACHEYPHFIATSAATIVDATIGICGSMPHFTVLTMIITIINTIGTNASQTLGSLGVLSLLIICPPHKYYY